MKKLSALLLFLLSYVTCFAQEEASVDMAFDMYKEGKIYVVIVTIVIIFAGLSVYLFSIDRRLKKSRKKNKACKITLVCLNIVFVPLLIIV